MINQVFVYGTLKSGNGIRGMNMMADADFVSEASTEDPFFDLYNLGNFPAAQPGGESYIKGEVWKITDQVLGVLDQIEGYPNFYNRQLIETTAGTAWIYYITDAHQMGKKIHPDTTNTVNWSNEYEAC